MADRFRYPRWMRLVRQKDFERAYRQGNRARAGVLVVVAVANGTDRTRLGLSVGRRIHRRAVARNRVRRVFREAFRLSYPELPKGVDLVLIPARPGIQPDLEETRRELVHLARKAHRRHLEKLAGEAAS